MHSCGLCDSVTHQIASIFIVESHTIESEQGINLCPGPGISRRSPPLSAFLCINDLKKNGIIQF